MASRASATARSTCTRRLCIPAVTGAWAHEGGGAFHSNSGIFKLKKTMIEGLDARDLRVRRLDQSLVGAVLTGEPEALKHGPPVEAMLIQNTNPLAVAPHQDKVRRGFSREDLFVCVHEQFMTDTARYADVVLPATMFLEHDDLYTGGGHQHLQFAPKAIDPPPGCRSNHEVVCALARAVGAEHPAFAMSPREIIDWTLRESGYGGLERLERERWLDCQPPFEDAHFLNGFGFPDKKFRFKPDWSRAPVANDGLRGAWRDLPRLPDHWPVNENPDERHPFKLATSPAHNFLNSSFTETPTSVRARAAARAADQPGRRRRARSWRRRRRRDRKRPGPNAPARAALRGREPGRARQRGRVASVLLPRRLGDQRARRRRQRGAVRRGRLSRRKDLGAPRLKGGLRPFIAGGGAIYGRRNLDHVVIFPIEHPTHEEAVRHSDRRV